MKMLIAFIHTEDLPAVQETLDRQVACFMSVTPIESYGPEDSRQGMYRGSPYRVRSTLLRLDIAVSDELVEATIEALHHVAAAKGEAQSDFTMFTMHAEPLECA